MFQFANKWPHHVTVISGCLFRRRPFGGLPNDNVQEKKKKIDDVIDLQSPSAYRNPKTRRLEENPNLGWGCKKYNQSDVDRHSFIMGFLL